ncbi:hypothetical protein LR007_00260 [candidate division NPL-UPA2 bacterium]|nr:hypothetical protein [candidate division NPL-UPA2 bacterium]
MPTYGIEEEVFVIEERRPSLQSLFYLSKLLFHNPRLNYFYTASNLSHLPDIATGLMAGIELATRISPDVHKLMEDLIKRRKDLARVCPGLILPIGHLIDFKSYSKTCALHIHIGNFPDRRRAYSNLAHFLPLLSLLTVNSPYRAGQYFGQSYRIYHSPFIGPLRDNPRYRFQDIIISRRLGTIELRIFDSVWDLDRIRVLLEAIDRIVNLEEDLPLDRDQYKKIRASVALLGYSRESKALYHELNQIYPLPKELLRRTASDRVRHCFEGSGLLGTYSALDNAYRNGTFQPREVAKCRRSLALILTGIAGYYIPKLPYTIWKTWRENW